MLHPPPSLVVAGVGGGSGSSSGCRPQAGFSPQQQRQQPPPPSQHTPQQRSSDMTASSAFQYRAPSFTPQQVKQVSSPASASAPATTPASARIHPSQTNMESPAAQMRIERLQLEGRSSASATPTHRSSGSIALSPPARSYAQTWAPVSTSSFTSPHSSEQTSAEPRRMSQPTMHTNGDGSFQLDKQGGFGGQHSTEHSRSCSSIPSAAYSMPTPTRTLSQPAPHLTSPGPSPALPSYPTPPPPSRSLSSNGNPFSIQMPSRGSGGTHRMPPTIEEHPSQQQHKPYERDPVSPSVLQPVRPPSLRGANNFPAAPLSTVNSVVFDPSQAARRGRARSPSTEGFLPSCSCPCSCSTSNVLQGYEGMQCACGGASVSAAAAAYSLAHPPLPTPAQLAQATKVLEGGHIFLLHTASAALPSSTSDPSSAAPTGTGSSVSKIVIFLFKGALYACHYAPGVTKYSQPFMKLTLIPEGEAVGVTQQAAAAVGANGSARSVSAAAAPMPPVWATLTSRGPVPVANYSATLPPPPPPVHAGAPGMSAPAASLTHPSQPQPLPPAHSTPRLRPIRVYPGKQGSALSASKSSPARRCAMLIVPNLEFDWEALKRIHRERDYVHGGSQQRSGGQGGNEQMHQQQEGNMQITLEPFHPSSSNPYSISSSTSQPPPSSLPSISFPSFTTGSHHVFATPAPLHPSAPSGSNNLQQPGRSPREMLTPRTPASPCSPISPTPGGGTRRGSLSAANAGPNGMHGSTPVHTLELEASSSAHLHQFVLALQVYCLGHQRSFLTISPVDHTEAHVQLVGSRLMHAQLANRPARRRAERRGRRSSALQRITAEHARSFARRQARLERARQEYLGVDTKVELRLLAALWDPTRGSREGQRRQEALRRLNEERQREERERHLMGGGSEESAEQRLKAVTSLIAAISSPQSANGDSPASLAGVTSSPPPRGYESQANSAHWVSPGTVAQHQRSQSANAVSGSAGGTDTTPPPHSSSNAANKGRGSFFGRSFLSGWFSRGRRNEAAAVDSNAAQQSAPLPPSHLPSTSAPPPAVPALPLAFSQIPPRSSSSFPTTAASSSAAGGGSTTSFVVSPPLGQLSSSPPQPGFHHRGNSSPDLEFGLGMSKANQGQQQQQQQLMTNSGGQLQHVPHSSVQSAIPMHGGPPSSSWLQSPPRAAAAGNSSAHWTQKLTLNAESGATSNGWAPHPSPPTRAHLAAQMKSSSTAAGGSPLGRMSHLCPPAATSPSSLDMTVAASALPSTSFPSLTCNVPAPAPSSSPESVAKVDVEPTPDPVSPGAPPVLSDMLSPELVSPVATTSWRYDT